MSELENGPRPLCVVLRDMGNGVTRIEGSKLLDEPPSTHCREGLECSVLSFPLSVRVEDAVATALASFYVYVLPEFRSGCFRSITETITEYYFW